MGSFGTPGGGPSCKQTSPRFHFLGCALGFSGIEAREVYYHFMRMGFEDDIPKKNVITPNSAIVLLGKSGRMSRQLSCWRRRIWDTVMYEDALYLLLDMCNNGVRVDEVVSVTVLSACAHLKLVRDLVIRIGLNLVSIFRMF